VSEAELLVSRIGRLGAIRLNRPAALNSLTLDMVRAFDEALDAFAADPSIPAVYVDGAGEKAFCAGGDIRRLYDLRDGGDDFKIFWREEFRLNARIAAFPKPYIVVMDGLVMGGGVGVSAHGDRRIVTERTRLAMPETGIGYIPDVGGTRLLARAGGVGTYMALAGASIEAADAIRCGFADMRIDAETIPDLRQALAAARDGGELEATLAHFARPPGESLLARHDALFDRTMRHARVEHIVDALIADGSDFARRAAGVIAARSPTSLKVTLALLRRAAAAPRLEDCLVNEYRAACSLTKSHDLYEGIRAAIVDKDRRPQWSPATLEEIDEAAVDAILAGTGDPDPIFDPWPAMLYREEHST
jgi:enoyl-CoA hydratase